MPPPEEGGRGWVTAFWCAEGARVASMKRNKTHKEKVRMKRNLFVYIGLSAAAALLIAGTVLGFLSDEYYYLGIIGAVVLIADVFALATVITQDNLNIKCGKLCDEKRYDEEKAME